MAPRAGIAWTPFGDMGTVVRAGFGFFYDRVPLNVYSFDQYPNQTITMFGPGGQITGGPWVYQNGLGTVNAKFPFVFQEPDAGNFSPRSATGNVQVEQPLSHHLMMRIGYTQKQSSGLVILNPVAPGQANGGVGANLLSGSGQSQYHQFEVTARLRLNEKRQLFFSYVRARCARRLKRFRQLPGQFSGAHRSPQSVRQSGRRSAEPLPDLGRRTASGRLPDRTPDRISQRLSLFGDGRLQNYVGVPNAAAFPHFCFRGFALFQGFEDEP